MPPKKSNGCAFGRENRVMIENIVEMFKDFKDNDFAHLAEDVKKLAKRPSWVTMAIVIILTNLVVGLGLAQILGR